MGDTQQIVERVFEASLNALEVYAIALGDRLGLYATLRDAGPLRADELATQAGIDARYAREWLEQQVTAGYLTADDPTAGAACRFTLPPAHAAALADPDGLDSIAPLARLAAGVAKPLDAIAHAYRTGGGVPWDAYGLDAREGQANVNRPAFLHLLPSAWVGAMPDIAERLSTRPARMADIGCGGGYACIGMARTFPQLTVDGFDVDAASVELARDNVKAAGLDDRITLHRRDASAPDLQGRYDLVTILEVLHDVARPVELLANARAMTADGGAVLVVDERVDDAFGAVGDPVERMMYGWSVVCCLPAGRTEQPSAATGTVLRASVLEEYARQAGFSRVEILDVENDFFRLYRLHA